MSDENAPTLNQIVPEGTKLGWSDCLYALLAFVGRPVWISTTPTEDIEAGPGIALIDRLHHVAAIERQDTEWGVALMFSGGTRMSVPKPGFRGALLDEGGDLTIVTDLTTVLIAGV